MPPTEPSILKRGKLFNMQVQRFHEYVAEMSQQRKVEQGRTDWETTNREIFIFKGTAEPFEQEFDPDRIAEMRASPPDQPPTPTLSSPRGRMDIFGWVDPSESYALILEVKNTDWDALAVRGTVRANIRRHIRQVSSYMQGDIGIKIVSGKDRRTVPGRAIENYDVSAALIYPRAPKDPAIREFVESEAGKAFIAVTWFDEPPPQDSPAWEAWEAMQRGDF